MPYAVKEIFYTLQGEGANTGRAAVFCRFSGCNLWNGRESDRSRAVCKFCDTDFVGTDGTGGGHFEGPTALADAIDNCWRQETPGEGERFVVCTGGEPLLQMDADFIRCLHSRGFTIAVETNGTCAVPAGIDWICCSPKVGAKLVVTRGHEMKLVFPQAGLDPACLLGLDFQHFFIQPMDGDDQARNLKLAIDYCRKNPSWRLSLQTHKLLGIP